jgi:hypothetical protein
MKVRDALVAQAPSLALQRACQDELAMVDAEVLRLREEIACLKAELAEARSIIAHKQAVIDELKIEYCPEEMGADDWKNYEAHQKPYKE